MKIKEFEALLDRHGSRFDAWPASAAREARTLLLHSAEARLCHERSLRIESWFEASRPAVDAAAVDRVIAGALRGIRVAPPQPRLLGWLRLPLAVPMPRLAFAVTATAIGFAVGFLLGGPDIGQAADLRGLPLIASAGDVLL